MSNEYRHRQRTASAVLNDYSVGLIKRSLLLGIKPRELAEQWGVGTETIRKISRGDSWWWVDTAEERVETVPPPSEAELSKRGLDFAQRLAAEGLAGRMETSPVLDKLLEETNRAKRLEEELLQLKEDDANE